MSKPVLFNVALKRWCKDQFAIPPAKLAVQSGGYISVRIRMEPPLPGETIHSPMRYAYSFPAEFRQMCLRTIYGKNTGMASQTSGGNVTSVDIAMHRGQWDAVMNEWAIKPLYAEWLKTEDIDTFNKLCDMIGRCMTDIQRQQWEMWSLKATSREILEEGMRVAGLSQ